MYARIFLLLFLVLGFGGAKYCLDQSGRVSGKYKTPDLKEVQAGYEANSLKKYSLGFDNLLSGLLWVQLLQKGTYTPVAPGELSWEFAQVDAITRLDPNFEAAYKHGAIFVSFFRRDKEGGLRILKKWVQQRPTFWKAHHLLGMHYYLELRQPSLAAPHILKAATLPRAPEWIRSLGIRLLSEDGAWVTALSTALDILPSTRDIEARYRIIKRIRSLRWNLARKAWNEALFAYQKEKHHFPASIEQLQPYYQGQSRIPLSENASAEDFLEIRPYLEEHFDFVLDSEKKTIRGKNPALESELKSVETFLPPGT